MPIWCHPRDGQVVKAFIVSANEQIRTKIHTAHSVMMPTVITVMRNRVLGEICVDSVRTNGSCITGGAADGVAGGACLNCAASSAIAGR